MVRVSPSSCIDSTEVTVAQYDAFSATVNGVFPQSDECSGNEYVFRLDAPIDDDVPVTVNWCNAESYCRWAGKRLCRRDEWQAACSADGTAFPYGDELEPGRCRDGTAPQIVRAVGAQPACASEHAAGRVYDMSGNAAEWLDDCETTEDGGAICYVAGGSYRQSEPSQLSCRFTDWAPRLGGTGDRGFRCCSE